MSRGTDPPSRAHDAGERRDSENGGDDDEEDRESSPATPFTPEKDDDTPFGDTDQHSDA